MADTKITALTALTAADPASDVLPIVDISDTTMAASGTTKKISVNNILGAGGTATLASATITGDLTVDTNVLKVNTTTNRVGINTTAPNQNLEITGSGNPLVVDGCSAVRLNNTVSGRPAVVGVDDSQNFVIWNVGTEVSETIKFLTGGGNGKEQYRITHGGVFNWYDGAGGTRMTLNANGLGIGVTPSAQLASYKSFQFGIGGNLIGRSDDSGIELSSNSYRNSGGNYIYLNTTTAASYRQYSGTHQWFTAPSGTAGNAITFTQAMTLDASGNLLVGTTGTVVSSDSRFRVSATAVPAVDAKTTAATQAVVDEWNSDTSGDNLFNRFWTESSPIAFRGSISYNRAGGLVAYNTTSDYRAKDIIGPVSNSGSLIDSLKVYVGKMKGATIERPMLIAHELQEVAPYAVSGEKDAVDADGKPKYQQMDASALVPLLIAEIKSLRARVQTLETR
jgi:hypothetical protein